MTATRRIHGGTDFLGTPRFDFSTNSNACGPCPEALRAVQQADVTHYPDSSYAHLRETLASFHDVDAARIVLAGGASEFIFRITAAVAQRVSQKGRGPATVHLPNCAYGDYAHAAQAWAMASVASSDSADLIWACEPSSPLGQPHAAWPESLQHDKPLQSESVLVLDRAYEPLRLSGSVGLTSDQLNRVWQLWTPNKALGLTGIRAAYAIAPVNAQAFVGTLEALAPSWPVGAHGVALLNAWVQPEVHQWLIESLQTLRQWKVDQLELLQSLGWTCLPSDANFFCAYPLLAVDVSRLRAAGIKLRDAASLGLPGHFRLSVQGPQALAALGAALQNSRR